MLLVAMGLNTLEPELTPLRALNVEEFLIHGVRDRYYFEEYFERTIEFANREKFHNASNEFRALWGKFVRHERWQSLGTVGTPRHRQNQ
jgi:hypothetical protein